MAWVERLIRDTGVRYRGVAWDAVRGARCKPQGSKVFDTVAEAWAWAKTREERDDAVYAEVGGIEVRRCASKGRPVAGSTKRG